MKDFQEFFLMSTEDVKRYAVEVLHKFEPDEETECIEIGDGNINYVFKIWSKRDGHSVIVKQADKLLRSSGRPLDIYRNKIEANILQLEGQLAPGYVPEVYYYDETMAATSMEDVSAFKNLRKELAANRVYPHLAENISTFMVDTLLPTTDLVLDRAEKKQRVKFYTNPELCEITEDLVLTEPYDDFRGRNIITEGNEAFVREFLYEDQQLHAEVGKLRERFMNNAQALIHGDLHSGSIFANEEGIRVLDPEFAFYGPMGYDIGNVIANLIFAWANGDAAGDTKFAEWVEQTIVDVVNMTMDKMKAYYEEHVTDPMCKNKAYEEYYLGTILADTSAVTGLEMIRRIVGMANVKDITTIADEAKRARAEKICITAGIDFIKNRAEKRCGNCFLNTLKDAIKAVDAQ